MSAENSVSGCLNRGDQPGDQGPGFFESLCFYWLWAVQGKRESQILSSHHSFVAFVLLEK